jgi:hypothetical protein
MQGLERRNQRNDGDAARLLEKRNKASLPPSRLCLILQRNAGMKHGYAYMILSHSSRIVNHTFDFLT